jgi:hypothetical protein
MEHSQEGKKEGKQVRKERYFVHYEKLKSPYIAPAKNRNFATGNKN